MNTGTTKPTDDTLHALIREIESFHPTPWTGSSTRQILEYGSYEERGLTFTNEDLALGQLYAGVAVLAKNMHDYLGMNPRPDAALFQDLIALVHAEERSIYGRKAFPEYQGLPADSLPRALAIEAAKGIPVMAALGSWRMSPRGQPSRASVSSSRSGLSSAASSKKRSVARTAHMSSSTTDS